MELRRKLITITAVSVFVALLNPFYSLASVIYTGKQISGNPFEGNNEK